jgi:VanZ family protein
VDIENQAVRDVLRWRPVWVAAGWLIAATILWLSLTPAPPKIDVPEGDKLGHFLGYGTLMFWFCQLYAARRTRILYAAAFAAMGVGLEFIQGQLGYRTYEVFDMYANSLGVLLGWALAIAAGNSLFTRIEGALSARLRG